MYDIYDDYKPPYPSTTVSPSTVVLTTTTGGATTTTTQAPVIGLVLEGEQGMWNKTALPSGTMVDARKASFTDTTRSLPSDEEGAIVLKGGSHLGLIGGTVRSDFPRNEGWSYYHDGARNHGGVLVLSPHIQMRGVSIDNVEDGIRCQDGDATDWVYDDIYMRDIHDDAIDSHWQCTGVIEDSLIEGCYVFISTRAASRPRFRDRVITVRNSLIWQKPFPDPHSSESRNPGHGSTFKWDSDGNGPGLALHNNIFLWQQDSNGDIGFPADGRVRIESCSGNVAVWVGSGSFPGKLGPPGCFAVTTDRSVWDDAVAAWKAVHGN